MATTSNPVDIVTASVAELQLLPKIGDERAEAIIQWRDENSIASREDIGKMKNSLKKILITHVDKGLIVFGEKKKLQAEIEKQKELINKKDIEIAELQKEIKTKQKKIDVVEAFLTEYNKLMNIENTQ